MNAHRLRFRPGFVLASLALLGGSGALAVPAGAAALPALTPNPGVCNQLYDVAALSTTNVWAVGSSCPSSRVDRTLVMHYNGVAWRTVTSPNVGSFGSTLQAVVALSPANVWAVGYSTLRNRSFRTLIEHWNGRFWSVVPSPNVGTTAALHAVSARSWHNIWAVGASSRGALTLHWNGVRWSVVTVAANNPAYRLYGVAVVGPSSVLATGDRDLGTRTQTLAMRWTGLRWLVVATPNPSPTTNYLQGGLAAFSPGDAWAVGWARVAGWWRPLALHWNGVRWSLVPAPWRGASYFFGVGGSSGRDVWVVGASHVPGGRPVTLVERWNGASWRIVPSPGGLGSELTGVDALSPSAAFAVGHRGGWTASRTLVLRWGGLAWRMM